MGASLYFSPASSSQWQLTLKVDCRHGFLQHPQARWVQRRLPMWTRQDVVAPPWPVSLALPPDSDALAGADADAAPRCRHALRDAAPPVPENNGCAAPCAVLSCSSAVSAWSGVGGLSSSQGQNRLARPESPTSFVNELEVQRGQHSRRLVKETKAPRDPTAAGPRCQRRSPWTWAHP